MLPHRSDVEVTLQQSESTSRRARSSRRPGWSCPGRTRAPSRRRRDEVQRVQQDRRPDTRRATDPQCRVEVPARRGRGVLAEHEQVADVNRHLERGQRRDGQLDDRAVVRRATGTAARPADRRTTCRRAAPARPAARRSAPRCGSSTPAPAARCRWAASTRRTRSPGAPAPAAWSPRGCSRDPGTRAGERRWQPRSPLRPGRARRPAPRRE